MTTDTKLILKELKDIKSDLNYLKEHITDPDTILSQDDIKALEEGRKDFKDGKTISLEDFEKELS